MKKAVLFSLIFFALFSLFVIVGGKFGANNGINNNSNANSNISITNNNAVILSPDEVAKHNNKSDCWMIIEGSVYELTDYFNFHPGGADSILKYCGQDGTEGFVTKDKFIPQDHFQSARALLNSYFLGNVNEALKNVSTTSTETGDNVIQSGTKEEDVAIINENNDSNTVAKPDVSGTLSLNKISQHNTTSDCWMILNNNVYDLSSYFGSHPGGDSNLMAYCGKDGTTAYNTKNGSGHSDYANSLLSAYYIGKFGSASVAQPVVNNTLTNVVAENTTPPAPQPILSEPVTPSPTVPVVKTINVALTNAEVAKHNSSSDCWSIFNNKVYDITSYFGSHPGGNGNLSQACGTDGTTMFNNIGHSGYASGLMDSYYIGNLNSSVSLSESGTGLITPLSPETPPPGTYNDDYYEHEDEYEDD